jgi:hypothetical protein
MPIARELEIHRSGRHHGIQTTDYASDPWLYVTWVRKTSYASSKPRLRSYVIESGNKSFTKPMELRDRTTDAIGGATLAT